MPCTGVVGKRNDGENGEVAAQIYGPKGVQVAEGVVQCLEVVVICTFFVTAMNEDKIQLL